MVKQNTANHIQRMEEKKAEKQKELDWILNEEVNPKLLRRELIVIYNILSSLQYKLGDAKVVLQILDKLQPHVAVDTNITKQAHELALGKN